MEQFKVGDIVKPNIKGIKKENTPREIYSILANIMLEGEIIDATVGGHWVQIRITKSRENLERYIGGIFALCVKDFNLISHV